MDKRAALKIISLLQRGIEARGVKVSIMILYGSFARGTYTDTSDIDVVVISEDFAGKDYWERIDLLSDVIYEVFAPIEAVAMTPEEWERGDSFISDYASDGEIVYAA